MIIITGAAGFIGSYLVGKLNKMGFNDLILVDRINKPWKEQNLVNKRYRKFIDRDSLFKWIVKHSRDIQCVFHLGAITDTANDELKLFQQLNVMYSQRLWNICAEINVPFIYASSAATYGNGEDGFSDSHSNIPNLRPLNLYGWSKQDFDVWALKQVRTPKQWVGLKFFNVYGPNEYHKGRMSSVVLHAYHSIKETGKMELFRSHHKDYKDGEQSRDFVFVDDIVDVMVFFMEHGRNSGIYNVGTGKARSFYDLTKSVFTSLKLDTNITFVDTPVDLRGRYQYYTEADIHKLRNIGYAKDFTELEEGVERYVSDFLVEETCY